MKRINLKTMSTGQLVELFAKIGIEQDRAQLYSETATYNKLYDRMRSVEVELKVRPGDHRRELHALYNHSNWQVRLMAAHATLALDPDAGRRLLQEIKESNRHPQAMDAGMAIWNLDRGIYKPK